MLTGTEVTEGASCRRFYASQNEPTIARINLTTAAVVQFRHQCKKYIYRGPNIKALFFYFYVNIAFDFPIFVTQHKL